MARSMLAHGWHTNALPCTRPVSAATFLLHRLQTTSWVAGCAGAAAVSSIAMTDASASCLASVVAECARAECCSKADKVAKLGIFMND